MPFQVRLVSTAASADVPKPARAIPAKIAAERTDLRGARPFIECLPTWLFIEVPLGADRGQFCTPPPCGGRTCSVAKPESMVCCLLYTSDAADERSSVDLGGRRII